MSDSKSLMILLIILGIFVLIGILGVREERLRHKKLLNKIKGSYGKANLKKISPTRKDGLLGYYRNHMDIPENSYLIDDITWHDLDMDTLFTKLNNTYSACGEEYLYYLLKTPTTDEESLNKLEKDISFYEDDNNKDERIYTLTKLAHIGKSDKNSVYDHMDYTNALKDKVKNGIHYFCILLLIAGIVLLFVSTGAGILLTVFAICFNILTYFKIRVDMLPYINSLKYIMRVYRTGKFLSDDPSKYCKNSESLNKRNEDIKKSCNALKVFAGKSKFVFSSTGGQGSVFSFLRDYLNMLVHIDLIIFNSMVKNLGDSYEHIDSLIGNLGYIESVIAIGSYRHSTEKYVIPEFEHNNEFKVLADNIYHPYIKNPVKNDFKTDGSVLITGSNASGKSTFLRTIAINIVMSETIHTALADRFVICPFEVYSSISISDDLLGGDSYYMAEIKAIKRVIDYSNTKKAQIIAFVDEVLRGTNTVERIAASTEILKNFAENGITCFAATHDIELTRLLEKNDLYHNYHFEEEMVDDDITFNYKINEGKATSRNAIGLLKLMGFSDSITDKASKMAQNFTDNGEWKLV